MKIPISQARQKLPLLVKQLQKHPGDTFEITVRHEVVARLTAVPLIEHGLAATSLLGLRGRSEAGPDSQPLTHGIVSEQKSAYLYGENRAKKTLPPAPRERKKRRPGTPTSRNRAGSTKTR